MVNPPGDSIFRQEALDYAATAHQRQGDVLRISPAWARWTPGLVLVTFVAAMVCMCVLPVPEYAEGPAVIWVDRTSVTAAAPGTVQSLAVKPGWLVHAGEPLLRVCDARAPGELIYIRAPRPSRDDERRCHPEDDQPLLAEGRSLGWVVSDILIRAGDHFNAGDVLVSLVLEGTTPAVIAALPAHYRPLLEKKDTWRLRLELAGHRYAYQTAEIVSIFDEALGPSAIRRYFGQGISDTLYLQGASTLVRARLLHGKFDVNNNFYRYYHGMQGTAQVRVRSQRALFALMPWLKAPFHDNDD